jgi:hypothetical protein
MIGRRGPALATVPPVIRVKRTYEAPAREDGRRVLVERLWPRGMKKEALAIDAWLKEVAPSTESGFVHAGKRSSRIAGGSSSPGKFRRGSAWQRARRFTSKPPSS